MQRTYHSTPAVKGLGEYHVPCPVSFGYVSNCVDHGFDDNNPTEPAVQKIVCVE
jgi:hypothetical protein